MSGGLKAVGRTGKQALQVYHDARSFESAGEFALEIEVVPARVVAQITKQVSLLTISLGSGSGCDATHLFSTDLLGENRGHIPRHANVYGNFAAERDRLQKERIAAYSEYMTDIQSNTYPSDEHDVSINNDEFEQFLEALNKRERTSA